VNIGDVKAISGTQDGMPYFLWGMKEPDYIMHMMAMGGPMGLMDECKWQSKRGGKGIGMSWWNINTCAHMIGTFATTTTIYSMRFQGWRKPGLQYGGSIVCLLLSWQFWKISAFLVLWFFMFNNNTIERCLTLLVFHH
jgi:hypothetical protein